MHIQSMTLGEFLQMNKFPAELNDCKVIRGCSSLFMLATFFNKASTQFTQNGYDGDLPSGIEGCMEFLEKNVETCMVDIYTENESIIGLDLRFGEI